MIIIISKKTNQEMISLRKNYKNYLEFKKLTDLRKTLNKEKQGLINDADKTSQEIKSDDETKMEN